jgi:hypothetical protein
MLPPTTDRLLTTSAAFISAKFEFERATQAREGMACRMRRSRGWWVFLKAINTARAILDPSADYTQAKLSFQTIAGFSCHGLDSETRDFRTSAELTPKWRGESRSVMARAGR